jgi:hypothetical protein
MVRRQEGGADFVDRALIRVAEEDPELFVKLRAIECFRMLEASCDGSPGIRGPPCRWKRS